VDLKFQKSHQPFAKYVSDSKRWLEVLEVAPTILAVAPLEWFVLLKPL
jgi:hypothetical protein